MLVSSSAANENIIENDKVVYQKNDNGLTYGSTYNISSVEDYPNLILVVGTNGRTGYVYREMLYPETEKDIDNYNQKIAECIKNGKDYLSIPVYSLDGKIKIDEYLVYIGTGTAIDIDEFAE